MRQVWNTIQLPANAIVNKCLQEITLIEKRISFLKVGGCSQRLFDYGLFTVFEDLVVLFSSVEIFEFLRQSLVFFRRVLFTSQIEQLFQAWADILHILVFKRELFLFIFVPEFVEIE